MRNSHVLSAVLATIGVLLAVPVSAQVIKDSIPGVTNPARIESTIACAGAITTQSVPEIKNLGFKSIINLREATEPGANVEAEAAAAKAAGISYAHVPFNAQAANPAVADSFIKAITSPGMEPAFVHCAGGNCAATMWFIKRVMVDKWDTNRAMAEAADLGFTNPALKNFMMDYVKAHAK